MDLGQLRRAVEAIRERNPAMKIKLNTVVNRVNWQDDFSDLISLIQPDKWKVLRVLPVTDQSMTVTDEEFRFFLDRHRKHNKIPLIEDNQDMVESYIMVDPQGRVFQNSPCSAGYEYSQPIVGVGAEKAFSQVNFDVDKFSSRYSGNSGGVA